MLVGHVEEVIDEGVVVVLAEAREVRVADDNVDVGSGEATVVMDQLAYLANGSQASSCSRSCADCPSTHFAVGNMRKWSVEDVVVWPRGLGRNVPAASYSPVGFLSHNPYNEFLFPTT